MIKKLISTTVVSLLFASALNADKVSLSTDQMGDFLIAPIYYAEDGVCSEVKVFNTNEKSSILAKITFREKISSQEVDLPIFLSPGDVWAGTVCETTNGHVILRSDDDSNHPAIADELHKGKDLTLQSKKAGHTEIDFSEGYIEIYPIAQFNEHSKQKVDKSVLVSRWKQLMQGNTTNPALKKNGVDGYSLSGEVTFQSKTSRTKMGAVPMLAFKGTHDRQITGSAIAYSNDTSPTLLLGADKRQSILRLLQHKVTSFTYDNGGEDQYIKFTYPFGYQNNQTRLYRVTVRDMSENKDKEEVIIFSPTPQSSVASMENEVATLSVKNLIAKTTHPDAFQSGMIQIKDITNTTDIQLGVSKNASYIPVKVVREHIQMKDYSGSIIKSAVYLPSK